MRIRLTISYIGTRYSGFQSQPSGNTIQDNIERALLEYFGGQAVKLYGAGRTDAGVHAEGQVAHFDIDRDVNCYKLCLGVNISLPSDIAIVSAEVVDEEFHARYSCHNKTYCYRLYYSSTRLPLLDINHAQLYRPLDIDKLRQASKIMLGEHDFVALGKSGSSIVGSVRTINSIELTQDNNMVSIYINGNAFLYNMVRNMVGVMVQYARGERTLDSIHNMLDSGVRQGKPLLTMPACGLTLMSIEY